MYSVQAIYQSSFIEFDQTTFSAQSLLKPETALEKGAVPPLTSGVCTIRWHCPLQVSCYKVSTVLEGSNPTKRIVCFFSFLMLM